MSNVSEAFEGLLQNLARGGERSDRLGRLLSSLWDESGHPTILALPEARGLVEFSLKEASECCATLGVETNDTRWVGIVAILHHASTAVREATESEAKSISGMFAAMQYKVRLLRDARSGQSVTVRLS